VRFDEDGSLLVQVESRDQKSLRLLRPIRGPGRQATPRGPLGLLDQPARRSASPARRTISLVERVHRFRHLELRARDGSLVRRLTEGTGRSIDLEGVDEIEGLVYFSAAKDGVTERHLYRVALDGRSRGQGHDRAGLAQDDCARDAASSSTFMRAPPAPPRAVLKDASGRQVRVLDANSDPESRSLALRPPELVTLKRGTAASCTARSTDRSR